MKFMLTTCFLITIAALTGCAVTHMRQPASEHVTLEVVRGLAGSCNPSLNDFIRILPDGNRKAGAGGLGWRVPDGKVLVITDVDWQFIHPNREASSGTFQTLRLFIENLEDPFKEKEHLILL